MQFYSKKLLSIAKKQFFDAIKLNRSLLSCMSESHKSQTIRISQKQLFPKLGTVFFHKPLQNGVHLNDLKHTPFELISTFPVEKTKSDLTQVI